MKWVVAFQPPARDMGAHATHNHVSQQSLYGQHCWCICHIGLHWLEDSPQWSEGAEVGSQKIVIPWVGHQCFCLLKKQVLPSSGQWFGQQHWVLVLSFLPPRTRLDTDYELWTSLWSTFWMLFWTDPVSWIALEVGWTKFVNVSESLLQATKAEFASQNLFTVYIAVERHSIWTGGLFSQLLQMPPKALFPQICKCFIFLPRHISSVRFVYRIATCSTNVSVDSSSCRGSILWVCSPELIQGFAHVLAEQSRPLCFCFHDDFCIPHTFGDCVKLSRWHPLL